MTIAQRITETIDFFYIAPVKKLLPLQTFRYGMCGAITVGLDALYYYLVIHYIICERFIDLGFETISPHIASLVIVFPLTTFNGFWLNRNVAFRHSPLPQGKQLARYLLSVCGSVVLTYLCMKFFVEVLHIWATPSKILTNGVTIIYSFLAQKYFTFRGSLPE